MTDVRFEINDITGKQIAVFNEGEKAEGEHQFKLSVFDFSSETYFYSVIANGQRITKKMTVIR